MSLMAGFDLVAEISKDALLRLIMKNLTMPKKMGGQLANPPFEVSFPVAAGKAHLIVKKLALDLLSDDRLTLKMSFGKGSVTVPGSIPVAAIEGEISITAPVLIQTSTDFSKASLTLDLGSATVGIKAPKLGPFVDDAQKKSEEQVRAMKLVSFPPAFAMVGLSLSDGKPVSDGSLTPLRFVRLEAHRINAEVMGLFGILLASNDASGDHKGKTDTAITSGGNICVSLSQAAFHSLAFCPAIAKQLKKSVGELPGSCGTAGSIDVGGGANLISLSDSLAEGHINVDASASKGGTCYEATLSLHGEISLSIKDSKLIAKLDTADPHIEVHLTHWYCVVAAAVVGGPLVFVVIEVVKGVLTNVVKKLIGDEVDKGLPGMDFTSFFGANFNAVRVTPEGLTVRGTLSVTLPTPKEPKLELDGSVTDSKVEMIGSGTYKTKAKCVAGEYWYTELLKTQVGTYVAIPTLLGLPLKLEWWITTGALGDPEIPLTGVSGSVSPSVSRRYPFPLPGGSSSEGLVRIAYAISGDQIQLTNIPTDGVFGFYLHVRATDSGGEVFEVEDRVQFDGHTAPIGDGYNEKLAACLEDPLTHPGLDYRWPAVDHPGEDTMLDFIHTVITSGDPAADEIITEAKLAHGASFYRALSPKAVVNINPEPGSMTLR